MMTSPIVGQRVELPSVSHETVRADERRAARRVDAAVPVRLTWKDRNGATRFASATTRDVSEFGVFVECRTPLSLPLFRLVQVQVESRDRGIDGVPSSLGEGRAVAAVYRIRPADSRGQLQGLALRLMVEPRRTTTRAQPARATA